MPPRNSADRYESVDPSTPVLVGVGQFSELPGRIGYQGLSAVDIAASAARIALADTGVDVDTVAAALDTVAGVRQFEISTPNAPTPLGNSDNYPRSVADRIGADPERAVLEVVGGQSSQHLITEFAGEIAAGRAQAVMVFGSEAISTTRHFSEHNDSDPARFEEVRGGQLEDRGFGLQGLVSMQLTMHGLTDAPTQYGLLENARRARLGLSRNEYALRMGELFAPFSDIAAENPYSAAPTARSAGELATVSERNRMIADPYPRYLVARDQVNQGAAVLLVSVRIARALGIAPERWVFIHGHSDLRERELMQRPSLSIAPASVRAARQALELAEIDTDALESIDLYSCFPIAVSNIADALDLAADDPRGLTVTGGLPFFGGAGNNYSMHAVAETVSRLRRQPGTYGFVGANGGILSKYSAAVYSTTPTNWRKGHDEQIQAELDSVPARECAHQPSGWATIETSTVSYGREGHRGIVIGSLDDGRRFVANTFAGDDELLGLLISGDPQGTRVFVSAFGQGNRIAESPDRMAELRPARRLQLQEKYEFVTVHNEGHILEVTIDRPQARNALTPQANDELDSIFDAYFADPDLWVAILTGAGDKSFCAGNDLRYSASGQPMWVPTNGFAGLTSRRDMTKPVIAAVNGFAMGGGCEIALATHMIVADPSATFALSEVKVGLAAGAGGLVRLPRMVPDKVANEMILTGRSISADEALAHGLVNRISQPGAVLESARELAHQIIGNSPTSLRVSLAVMNATRTVPSVVDAITDHSSAIDELLVSEDMIEGLTSFGQKRNPVWKNR